VHRKGLREKRTHAVSKQHDGRCRKLLADETVYGFDIRIGFLPTIPERKMAGLLAVPAVPAVVMNTHSETTIGRRSGETGVAIPVLAQSMQYLNDAGRIAIRLPGLHMDDMAILRGQLMVLVM